jgi:hypothetical protein
MRMAPKVAMARINDAGGGGGGGDDCLGVRIHCESAVGINGRDFACNIQRERERETERERERDTHSHKHTQSERERKRE